MPVELLDDIFDLGADVLGTQQDTRGVILAQTGDVVGQDVRSDNAEFWQHVGFSSRPAKSQPGKSACQGLSVTGGSNDIVFATRDSRCSLPAGLKEGETCLYAGGPQNLGTSKINLADDGSNASITIQVKQGNTSGGQTVSISINSAGEVSITNSTGTVSIAQDGTITIDAGGIGKVTVSPSSISLGSSASDPVALAPDLQTWATAIMATLTPIATAFNASVGIPVVGVAVPPPTPLAATVASTVVKAQK